MSIPVSAVVLKYILEVVTITAFLKRVASIPWIMSILGLSGTGGGVAIALTFVSGIAAGVAQYATDGSLTTADCVAILQGVIGAAGGYSIASGFAQKVGGKNE